MAKKFLVNIDLGGNQLLSPLVHNATSSPTAYGKGQLWFDTTNNQLNVYNGTTFTPLTTGGTAVTSLNSFTGGVNIYGTTNQISVTNSSGSITLSLPSTISVTTACATNFYGTFNGTATNATQLGGQASTYYAPIASPTFTGTVNLGSNTATGSVSYATNAGNSTTTSQTNFTALTISGSSVATQSYVTSLGYLTSSGSIASASNSASLGGQPASYYAPIASPNFTTGASVGGAALATQSYVTGTAWNNTSASVNYATNSGNSSTTSQTNFTSLTISGSNVATQNYVTSTAWSNTSASVGTANNSASLNGQPASYYAPITNPNFTTGASVAGAAIATQSYVTGTAWNNTSASVNYATNAGNATTTSQTNFTSLTISGSSVATQAYVGTASVADSAKLGGTVAASYALLASPSFTGTVNLGSNTATGSVSYALNSASLAGQPGSYYYPASSITTASVAYATNAGTATNSTQLGGVAAASYALLSSANFTAASVGGSRIITTSDTLAAHAATTSSQLAGVISDETGTGNLVFNTSPSFVTPNIGNATGSVTYATNAGTATTAGAVTGATSANTNSAYVVRDSSGRAQFTDPSVAQDAATKNYVDTVAQGLNTHDAVTVATTATLPAIYANGTADASGGLGIGATLTASANGTLTIDNILLTVNDRVLVKNQSSGLQNGIYVVTASGAAGSAWTLTRAEDANNSIAGEMAVGDFIFVVSGSVGAGTGYVLNSASTSGTPTRSIKIGTDIVTYSQFSGQGTYTAGNGISITGNTFSVLNGTGLAFSSSSLTFASGTTSQSATGVSGGAYSYGAQKQVATISGNSSATSFAINHNINSRDIQVQVYQTSTTPDTQYAEVEVDIVRTSTSVVTISFATAPVTGTTYNVVIVG